MMMMILPISRFGQFGFSVPLPVTIVLGVTSSGHQTLSRKFVEITQQICNLWVVKYTILNKILRPEAADAAGSATKIVFLPIYASCGALVQRDWMRSLSLESEFLTVSVSISIICTTDTVI